MPSKRTKATDISKTVREKVYERDSFDNVPCCIMCGSSRNLELAHFIPRSSGGLGIEENIVTLCNDCHKYLDQSVRRKVLLQKVRDYLDRFYPNFKDEDRKYKKGEKYERNKVSW